MFVINYKTKNITLISESKNTTYILYQARGKDLVFRCIKDSLCSRSFDLYIGNLYFRVALNMEVGHLCFCYKFAMQNEWGLGITIL